MKAKLKIISRGDGWTDNVEQPAELLLNGDCAQISYKLDGDDCALTVSADEIKQTRRGGVNICLSIAKDRVTRCEIGEGALSGGYEIVCKSLSCTVKALGVNADVRYLSGPDKEPISLKIRATAIR